MISLYYTPPSDKIFNEVKQKAIAMWRTKDDTHGYATEKISYIEDIKNVSDNVMYIVAMFDLSNKAELANTLSPEAKAEIRNRLIDGGALEVLSAI